MADGFGAGDLFRSQILRQGLEDTQYPQQQIAGMMQGMQPEQMAAFFQNPEVLKQFQSFGVDPQAILAHTRQSPFFPNSFMQGHPLLGGALSAGMANAAATPDAPLVSGAGSGISRAMQGMYGGPEMLRHYQLAQMMAPMGALGSMMPTFGEQRRRAIEEAIIGRENAARGLDPKMAELAQIKAQTDQMRADAAMQTAAAREEKADQPTIHMGPIGTGITSVQHQRFQPEGGQRGVDMVQTGQGHPMMPISGPMAGQQQQMPGYGLTPEQQEGWFKDYQSYDDAAMERQFRAKAVGGQTDEKGALLKAQVGELGARTNKENAQAAEARWKASPEYRILQAHTKSDQWLGDKIRQVDENYQKLMLEAADDKKTVANLEQQRANEVRQLTANYLVQMQHSNLNITPEEQQWLDQYKQGQGALPAQVSPNAPAPSTNKPTSSKGNQQGPPTSPTTATNPQAVW